MLRHLVPGSEIPTCCGCLYSFPIGTILFTPCIWLLVSRLQGMIWFNCSVKSRRLSFSLVTSISVTLLGVIRLLSVISDFSLCCLNSGFSIHYHRSTDSFSSVDLSFCSFLVVLDFTWSRICSFFGSNHYPILLSEVHPFLFLWPRSQSQVDWIEHKRASAVARRTFHYTRHSSWRRYASSLRMDVLLSVV